MDFYTLFRLNKTVVNVGGLIKSAKYYLFNRNYITGVKRNSELFARKKSDTCYVCALGPSLKQVDFSRIKGDTIVVNEFFRAGRENPDFVPTFYLMIDTVYKNVTREIQNFKDGISQYCGKETVYLLNSKFEEMICNYNFKGNFYYLSCFKGLFNHKKEFRIDRVMPAFGNVACVAIACAIALGYKKIFLLGCDFNSFASRSLDHCYGSEDRVIKMSYELYCYSMVADMHDQLQAYAKKHGITIINTTKGSLIDAYPYEIDESLYK